jgi:P27 family predicted phage terminase small subunit
MGTAKAVDATGLAMYCESVARFRAACAVLARAGLLLRDPDTGAVRKNPAVAQARDASIEARLWAREFGLTPAARQPLRVEHTITLPAERLLS